MSIEVLRATSIVRVGRTRKEVAMHLTGTVQSTTHSVCIYFVYKSKVYLPLNPLNPLR